MAASGSFADRIVGAFAAPFVALRVPPNWITVLGGLLILIPAAFAADGRYLWAGLTLGFVAMMDTVDGHVARATNRTTPFGGFLDSVIDRVSDGIILIGIGLGTDGSARWWAVLGAGLIGQYATSYARARAYEAGWPPRALFRQLFERPERIIFVALLFIATDLLARVRPEIEVLYWGMVIYATLTLFTALTRVLRVRRFFDQTNK